MFDISTAVPIVDKESGPIKGGNFDLSTARSANTEEGGKTAFEQFQKSEIKNTPPLMDRIMGKVKHGIQSGLESYEAFREPAASAIVNPVARVFGKELDVTKPMSLSEGKSDASRKSMAEAEKKHPAEFEVGQIAGGMAPFLVTAPLFPQTLIGTSSQFGLVGAISEYGRQKVEDSLMKPDIEKNLGILKETAKGVLSGPIWHYASELKFIGRPVATALAKAGTIGAGSATLDMAFGDDLPSALKQGGILSALSLVFELPHLKDTLLGRGVIERVNTIAEEKGIPKIDTETADEQAFKTSVLETTKALAPDVKAPPEPPQEGGGVMAKDYGYEVKYIDKKPKDYYAKHFPDKKVIEVYTKGRTQEQIQDTLDHELGHVVDYKRRGIVADPMGDSQVGYDGKLRPSMDSDIYFRQPQFLEEAKAIRKEFPKSHSLATTQKEIWADAYKLYKNSPDKLKEIAPNIYKTLDDHLSSLSTPTQAKGETPPQEGGGVVAYHGTNEEFNNFEVGRQTGAQGRTSKHGIWFTSDKEEASQYAKLAGKRNYQNQAVYDKKIKKLVDASEKSADRGDFDAQEKFLADAEKLENEMKSIEPKEIIKEATMPKNMAVHNAVEVFNSDAMDKIILKAKKDGYDGVKFTNISDSPFGLNKDTTQYVVFDPSKLSTPTQATPPQEGGGKCSHPADLFNQPKLPEITNEETKKLSPEAGQMDLRMIPGFAELSEALSKAHDEYVKTLVPPDVGKEAKYASQILREQLGLQARAYDRLNDALKVSREKFEKATVNSNLDFIDKMESGTQQELPEHQAVANTLRNLYDTKWAEVTATGKTDAFIENYFAHIWEKPGKMGQVLKQFMGKKPLYGTKSFLKQRVIPTVKEGIELGFKPVSYNPIDLTMLKIREMDRFLAAHRSRTAIRTQGLEKFVKTGGEKPEGWMKIKDPSSDVYSMNENKELVLRGSYYTQPDVTRLFDNHLAPGLQGNWLYDIYRGAGNTLNQFQLGLSAFHLGFTSMDATVSKFALGINKLSTGDVVGAGKDFAEAPFAPVTNFMQGRALNEAWHGRSNNPLMNTIADAMATAGGRAKMDTFYATKGSEGIKKALQEGKIVTAALKVPWAIVEKMSKPIMEYIVPRQKMGVFADMMKMELERNPDMTHAEMRDKAQKAWDSVDNRMGQLVYDNLFWNKAIKDMGMASVRSLGWNLGTIREVGGGIKDVKDIFKGKGVSYRTAYVMALPMVAGLYGAFYHYLHTGEAPKELKDYYFPKNGALDKKGQPSRVSLPTYMKDIYHYTTNPVQTVLNKFNPVNNAVIQMLANKDFYGVEIRHADDPAMAQVLDEAKFMAGQFLPFGIRNLNRSTAKGAESKIEPFIGITPAPYDIDMTKAEKAASEMAKAKIPVGSRTKEQAKQSQVKQDLRNKYTESKDIEVLRQAVTDGKISQKEQNEIIKQDKMSRVERLTQHLSFEETASLMNKATPSEKEELEAILEKKRRNLKGVSLERKQKIDKVFEELFGS